MSIYRAYVNADGRLKSYVLTHDVKKAIAQYGSQTGWVNILSSQATTAVALFENDATIIEPFMQVVFSQFQSQIKKTESRRSGLGAAAFHQMAAMSGLSLTIPFDKGKLLTSPFQDVMALDYEPKAGRREFIMSVLPFAVEGKK